MDCTMSITLHMFEHYCIKIPPWLENCIPLAQIGGICLLSHGVNAPATHILTIGAVALVQGTYIICPGVHLSG